MAGVAAAVEPLAAACGAAHVRPATAADAVAGVPARVVCAPGDTAEVAAVLRTCAAHGWRAVARGSGSKLAWGAPPAAVDVVVDTGRLDTLLEHAAGDLVLRVQAGVRYDVVQRAVGTAGQRLALDSPYERATIGGIVATATAGPLRLLYGTVRDLLIGITVVLSDGTVASSGGRVVKNVAGYDLGKLYAGSFGTLGIVTEAVFRVHPLPAASAYVEWLADDPETLAGGVARLRRTQAVPSAVEVERRDGRWALAVLVEGSADGVAARAADCRDALGGGELVDRPATWGRLPGGAGRLLLKVVAEPAAVGTLLAAVGDEVGRYDGGYALRGSAGAGVVHVAAALDPAQARAALAGLRARLADRDGSVVVLDAPADVRTGLDVWGPVAGLALMRRIKAEFDPAGVLAPQRFVGAI